VPTGSRAPGRGERETEKGGWSDSGRVWVDRHFASQLSVYATGAEIEFADRDSVEHILAELGDRGYPVRAMIHEVVTSDLFGSQ